MSHVSTEEIEKILRAGSLAKVKLYQDILRKIKDGKSLNASEVKTLHILERELEAQTNSPDIPRIIQTYSDAASYCGFSKRTLSHHIGKGNIRQNGDGTFDREELDRFLSTHKGRRKKLKTDADRDLIAEREMADLRWRLARSMREEILVDQLKENLVARDDIAAEWAARVTEVTSGLSSLADRLPGVLEGKTRAQMQDIIATEVRNLRNAYAREGKYSPDPKLVS